MNYCALGFLAVALVATGCGRVIPLSSESANRSSSGSAAGPKAISPRSIVQRTSNPKLGLADHACIQELLSKGAKFEILPDTRQAPGCEQIGTVKLKLLKGERSSIAVVNIGPVTCETAIAFNDWAQFGVDRGARQILNQSIVGIETMGSYACNSVATTDHRASHAAASAIDVSGFLLADGRRITIKRDWQGGEAATREFLRVVFRSACKRFRTALGPSYGTAYQDQFHLDRAGAQICR